MNLNRTITNLKYHFECLNPFTQYIFINDAPLELKFYVHKRDAIGRTLYKKHKHEPILTDWIVNRFHSNYPYRFIDIGANIGYFSCIFSKLAGPNGKVFAFEPEPKNFELLNTNLILNNINNILAQSIALGDTQGSALLYKYKNSNQGRHSLVDKFENDNINVQVSRLDDILESIDETNDEINLIKIDIEGYEPFALNGAVRTLQRTNAIVTEFSPNLICKSGVEPREFLQKIADIFPYTYILTSEEIKPISIDECLGIGTQIDLLFLKNPT